MQIFVEDLKDNLRITNYESSIIPKKNEILYFPHHGQYIVKEIEYIISDDKEINTFMWIDIKVKKI